VTVYTKSHEEASQWVWTSTVGSHQYSIKEDEDPASKMARGTRVVLHLKVRRQGGGGCLSVCGDSAGSFLGGGGLEGGGLLAQQIIYMREAWRHARWQDARG